jgi:hypothetical protein
MTYSLSMQGLECRETEKGEEPYEKSIQEKFTSITKIGIRTSKFAIKTSDFYKSTLSSLSNGNNIRIFLELRCVERLLAYL